MAEIGAVPAPDPKLRPTYDEREAMRLIQAGLKDYYDQMIEMFIFGKEPFTNYDAFLEECEKKGSIELGEMMNTIWTRQNS